MPLALRRSHTAIAEAAPTAILFISQSSLGLKHKAGTAHGPQGPQVPQGPQGPQVVHELSEEKYTEIKSKIKNESLMFPQIEKVNQFEQEGRREGAGGCLLHLMLIATFC